MTNQFLKKVKLALLISGVFFFNSLYAATPPTHTQLLYSDDLQDATGSIGTIVNSSGQFLTGQGWKASSSSSQLKITLPANLPSEGTLAVTVTNFNPVTQNVSDKQNIVNLYSRSTGAVDGSNPAGSTANLRTGTSYSDGPGKAGFKLLAAAEWLVNGRLEERTMQSSTWNTRSTYEFKIVWTEGYIFFLFNGTKKVELLFQNQYEPFRYIFIGRDNQYPTGQPGPVYSNLRIYSSSTTPPPDGLVFSNITFSAGTEGVKAVETVSDPPDDTKTFGHGVSFGDYDKDGYYDFVYTNAGGLSMADVLYMNQGNNTFINESATRNVNDSGHTHGIVNADWDNDGDLDLFYSNQPVYIGDTSGRNRMYRNDGDGVFTEITDIAGISSENSYSRGAIALDINNDGWQDLFVLNWGSTADTYNKPNEMYLNDGDGTFTRVDRGANGPTTDSVNYGRQGVTAGDIDNDGDIDIYVCRRGNVNWLYVNDGSGNFTEQAATRGVAGTSSVRSHGAAFVDIDRDGDLDLFVMNYGTPSVALPQMWAFYNNGNGYFTDQTFTYSLTCSGYSMLFGDVDNDADTDMYLLRNSEQDAGTRPQLYLNDGTGSLTYTYVSALEVDPGDVRGGAMADIDNDGDLDIYMACSRGINNFMFRNDLDNSNHYIDVLCTGPDGDYGGFGSKVYVYQPGHLGDNSYLLGFQESVSNYSYLCQNQTALHFGLGSYTTCDVRIKYTDGTIVNHSGVEADQVLGGINNSNLDTPQISAAEKTGTNNLKLTWNVIDGAAGYNVYRGTGFDFTADIVSGSNRVAASITDQDPSTDGVQWTDTGSVTNNAAINYFYKVAPVNSSAEGNLSDVFGEFDYQLVTTATTSFNEIALPLNLAGITKAADLLNAITNCNSVAYWDASVQGYYQYIPGLSFTNFDILAGHPYYVNVTSGTFFTLTGTPVTPQFTLTTTATTNFNEVMVPLNKTDIETAIDLLNDIAYCNSIAKWDASIQGYYQYVPGLAFTNFAVNPGYPYYVNVTTGSTWPVTVAGKTNPQFANTTGQSGSSAPHLVYGKINGDVKDFTFTASLAGHPEKVLSQNSPGCGIKDGYWYVQIASFGSHWSAGDVVNVLVTDANNQTTAVRVALTFDAADAAESIQSGESVPAEFKLYQNYPNPFNPETVIQYEIPRDGLVSLAVYNINGQQVRTLVNEYKKAGTFKILWNGIMDNGISAPSGAYIFSLKSGNTVKNMKAVLVK